MPLTDDFFRPQYTLGLIFVQHSLRRPIEKFWMKSEAFLTMTGRFLAFLWKYYLFGRSLWEKTSSDPCEL
ncbi:hypothetical protein RB195_009561 [Necator americanus]|uniref:Bestrophin homolog n=1 Tax=Necator americanus TaxID=51031 RepID=A0ABR1CV42_NECAM